jgi:rare lipoprotein A
VDGVRTKRRLLQVKLVRNPVPTIIGIGAGFPGCTCDRGSESGKASWYDADGLTAAHPSLPFGTVVRVTNLDNGRSVNVVIRDRGPFVAGRIIDMSRNAFSRIASPSAGVIRVTIRW